MNDLAASNEPLIRLLCFVGIFGAMALWEAAAPRRSGRRSRRSRWPSNLGIVLINTALIRIIAPTAIVGASFQMEVGEWGLLNQLTLPAGLAIVLSVLALDLAVYLQHVLFHAVPALWRVHRMHHSDVEFDVTTGVRFHPLEIGISFGFKLAAVMALGAPPMAVLIFEVLLNGTSMFNHGNVRMPAVLDRMLRWIVVTPDMHRVHHSLIPSETNSNYGFNLPWWDRLLGTYRAQPTEGHEHMIIGIEAFRAPAESRLDHMMTQPFRGDWQLPVQSG